MPVEPRFIHTSYCKKTTESSLSPELEAVFSRIRKQQSAYMDRSEEYPSGDDFECKKQFTKHDNGLSYRKELVDVHRSTEFIDHSNFSRMQQLRFQEPFSEVPDEWLWKHRALRRVASAVSPGRKQSYQIK
ncbi:unnamed protein product [Protopolystoma xenopodis]|uniref:Uncharacterized protein n=1 Tax=Protopolystoma xenopodis TaxID=117903 RepID=A0A3S5AM27_9PLAT|nr:unnamed protein product [Protopolystoma xenopodis]